MIQAASFFNLFHLRVETLQNLNFLTVILIVLAF